MKNLVSISLIICSVLVFLSCNKDNASPGCDVNGFWVGEWVAELQDSGTFISEVTQHSADIEGRLIIRLYSENNQNYATEYDARIEEKKFSSTITVGNVGIKAKGSVGNTEDTVTGTFSVQVLSMEGTFNGKKIPSHKPEITETYSFQGTNAGDRVHDVLCVNNQLWFFIYPYIYVNNEAVLKVIVTDLQGNKVGEKYFPYVGITYSFDGQDIWCIENGNILHKFDTAGESVNTYQLTSGSHQICGNGQNLFLSQGIFKLLKTNYALETVDTIDFKYVSPYNITFFDNKFLVSETNNIFKYDTTGKILSGYSYKSIGYFLKIITNNNKVWGLIEEYNTSSSSLEPSKFRLYDLSIEP